MYMERTTFYLFFKWQYQLRHDFLHQSKTDDFDEYLTTREEKDKHLKPIQEIFRQYLNNDLEVKHLFTLTPKKIRRGHHSVKEFTFQESILSIHIDLSETDVQKERKSIFAEIEGALDMCSECKDEGSPPPKKFQSIGHEHYWIKPSRDQIKQFTFDFHARFIGIILWDWSKKYQNMPTGDLISMMLKEYPEVAEKDFKNENEDDESKYRKRLKLAETCIESGDFLNR